MGRFVPVLSSQTRAWGREFVHVCFGLLGRLVQVGANLETGLELCDEYGFGEHGPETPNSVGFLALTEFRGESSVGSSQPALFLVCQSELTKFFRRTHRVCRQTQ